MVSPNTSMSADCYTPIVKCKQGELGALALLDATARGRVLPLVETREGTNQAGAIATAWPDAQHVALIHPLNLDDSEEAMWAAEIVALFEALRASNTTVAPVATTDDSAATVAALAQVVAIDGRGACIRVDAEEIALASAATVAGEINQLVADLKLGYDQCDLLLDVGLIRDSVVARVATAEAGLRVLPNVADWRNVVCGFSAFPESLGEIATKGGVTQISRDDAIAYAALVARQPDRLPNYADYTVGTPFYADVPWAPVPAIRYAESDNWMVHRGSTRQNRSAQYVQLARDVVAAPYFAGAAVSAGDRYLADVAAGRDGPGNPMTYVRAATSRHVACVLDRLSTIGVP